MAEPTVEDLFRIHGHPQPFQPNHAISPFCDYSKMTRLFARVADKVNDCSFRSRETQPPSRAEFVQASMGLTTMPQSRPMTGNNMNPQPEGSRHEDRADHPSQLMLLEAQMTHVMGSLDPSLRFSAEALKRHAENKTASMLLHLHLWVGLSRLC